MGKGNYQCAEQQRSLSCCPWPLGRRGEVLSKKNLLLLSFSILDGRYNSVAYNITRHVNKALVWMKNIPSYLHNVVLANAAVLLLNIYIYILCVGVGLANVAGTDRLILHHYP